MNNRNSNLSNYRHETGAYNRHSGTSNRHNSRISNRRRAVINRYAALIIFTSVIILLISLGGIIVNASSYKESKPLNKYYTSITISDNDTLWSLEDKYNTGIENKIEYINSIKTLNNMTDDTLYKGENLLIYYYSDEIKWFFDTKPHIC